MIMAPLRPPSSSVSHLSRPFYYKTAGSCTRDGEEEEEAEKAEKEGREKERKKKNSVLILWCVLNTDESRRESYREIPHPSEVAESAAGSKGSGAAPA